MKKFILFLLILMIPGIVSADLNIGVGLGKGIVRNQFGAHENFERAIKIGYIYNIWNAIYIRPELGGYLAFGQNRKHGGYLSAILGIRVNTALGIHAYVGAGPTVITSPDNNVLSGYFQFNLQSGICIKDISGFMICGEYSHLSNAGIKLPNRGLDMFGIGITFCGI